MKILLTSNKTYRGQPDMGFWYTYTPLEELGHEVYWYDTVNPEEKDYNKIIETFKPDLIFCCMTGDSAITPYEPWQIIKRETSLGRIKTFNWFCDDGWRFNSFSKDACQYFNVCSTPEPFYINKFKEAGYNNIILGAWYANSSYYSQINFHEKDIDISFVGYPTPERQLFFKACNLPIYNAYDVSQDELFRIYSRSKIGLNLSRNVIGTTQMKLRMFEVLAGSGLLMTEYHEGIEEFFEIDKEIITFKSIDELTKKTNFLLKNPRLVERIADAGHKRFLKEHDSKIRLKQILKEIAEC